MSSILVIVLRQFSECQSGLTFVERLRHYGNNLQQEAPIHIDGVRPSWQEKGRITFTNVQMRYRNELPLVLQGLTMDVRSGERIEIIGRTGTGKSSIVAALFRLAEPSEGTIKVDNLDITTVGLQDLRTGWRLFHKTQPCLRVLLVPISTHLAITPIGSYSQL